MREDAIDLDQQELGLGDLSAFKCRPKQFEWMLSPSYYFDTTMLSRPVNNTSVVKTEDNFICMDHKHTFQTPDV